MASLTSNERINGDYSRTRSMRGRLESPLDIAALLDMFLRRWRLFAAIVVVVTAASVLLTLRLTPVFSSAAEIKIDPTVHREMDTSTPTDDGMPDQAVVDTEVSIMHSRAIATLVVDELHLANDPEFNTPKLSLAKRLLGAKLPPQTAEGRRDTALAAVEGRLETRREGGTYVVSIGFRSKNPDKAALIANAFAQAYIQNSLSTHLGDVGRQAAWLDQRLSALGAQAESADDAVAKYKAANGIAAIGQGGETVNDTQISQIGAQIASAESDAAAARSNLAAARSQMTSGGLDSVSSVLNSNVVADLRRQRAEVMRNADEINSRYGPLHPEAIKVHQQLESLDIQIKAESQRIVAGLQSAANSANARASALRSSLGTLQGQQSANERASVQADALQRSADAKRLMYNQLAQSAQTATTESRSQETRGRIVDAAQPAGVPSFPNRRLFAVLGLVMGVVAGAAVVLLLETLDNTIRTADDVENALGVELIASIPRLNTTQYGGRGSRRPFDFVIRKPMSGFAEALRTVRSTLVLSSQEAVAGHNGRVIAVTSALPDEGKTTCAAALGRIMGMSGEKVLLIDCDLRRRSLQSMVAEPAGAGLLDVLAGQALVEQALQPDKVQGVDILTTRDAGFTPTDVLGGEDMRRLLAEMRTRYDYIVLDAPPVLAVADARTISAMADDVLLIVRWRRTTRQAAAAALARLENDGAPLAGVVLTMVDPTLRGGVGAHNPAYYYRQASRAYYQD